MRITPTTEEKIAQNRLMPFQTYDAYCMDAEETISKAGNEMMVLTVVIRLATDNRDLKDYLTAKSELKLLHLAEATGNKAKYDKGELAAADIRTKNFRVKTGIQRDKTGQYPDRVVIEDYLPLSTPQAAQQPASVDAAVDGDAIPF